MSGSSPTRYPSWLPLLLGFLGATGPLSTDMYLPAFPSIEAEYGVQMGSVQITLAAWFLGLAIGQLTQGTLSDRFGRRAPLTVSTAIFTLASLGCALSPNLHVLTLMRLIAALAGSASLVIPAAIVRDLATGHAAAKLMSRLILVRGVAPIVGPPLGGLLLSFASWRWIFGFCAIYGGICWLLVVWQLPDTLPRERRVREDVTGLVVRYLSILRERQFLVHAAINGATFFTLFAFLGGAPGVFIDGLHFSPSAFGLVFSSCVVFYVICAQFNPRALASFGAARVMQVTTRLQFLATLVFFAIAFLAPHLQGGLRWWMPLPPLMLMMATQGFINTNATVGGLHRHSAHAGSASALMGMTGFCLAAVSGLLSGMLSDSTPRGMAVLMLLGGSAMLCADWWRRRMLARV